ncbi:MAG: sigma-54 dependent transcriptional regulator, partial [Myxococcota bacterium]
MNHASTINPRVLVVDDDDSARNFVARALTRQGFQTSASEGGRQAISLLATESFDAIVCDLLMPEVDGLDVLRHCGSLSPRPPFIMLTAHGNVGVAVDAMKLGAVDFLEKPVSPTEIDAALRHAISRTKAPKSTRTRRKLGLVGSESWLRPFTELLEKVATSDAVVLIEGETGTGKSAVARQIYQLSGRAKGPFLAVNCANMTNSLLENELFGHVKGAFTGAVGQPGKVEKARGGTLFLDEIGELPPDLQPKLLQLLQERSFTPVGGTTAKDADVRFIAATNRELEQEALAGRFRPDLYYRLEVVKLTIPPLRQRLEDIPILLEHFRHFAVDEHGRAPIFPRDTVEALGRYPWPGNVRELE